MRLAGRAVARRAAELTKPGDAVLVLAGKGHNGDDACYAAESELLAGCSVRVIRVMDPESALDETVALLKNDWALIVDGLFGIGLNRPLSAAWIRLIQEINQSAAPILAVDVPSGLNAETGEPMGDAIRAVETLTLGAIKEGMLKLTAANFVGRLRVAGDIGLVPCPVKTGINWIEPEDFSHFPPRRLVAGHKGTFGHLGLIAGSLGYHGASVLAARGAQRAQPGLITLLTAENVYLPVAGHLQSVMVRPWTGGIELPATCSAIAAGPGLASSDVPAEVKTSIGRVWKESKLPVLADASALEWLAPGPVPEKAIRVITPHPGEAARLLRTTAQEIQADRFQAVRQLSRRWGNCYVVLKGHQTVIGREGEELFVNSSGNPFLAQGGSGDLLAGYLGGLLAQPELQADAGKTIRYAVWEHGAAADQLLARQRNWTVEELADVLGNAGGSR